MGIYTALLASTRDMIAETELALEELCRIQDGLFQIEKRAGIKQPREFDPRLWPPGLFSGNLPFGTEGPLGRTGNNRDGRTPLGGG